MPPEAILALRRRQLAETLVAVLLELSAEGLCAIAETQLAQEACA